jgi:hypothetical protein
MQKLLPTEDATRILHEKREEIELDAAERDGAPLERDTPTIED